MVWWPVWKEYKDLAQKEKKNFMLFLGKEGFRYIFCAFRQMTQPWSFGNVWDEKWGGSAGITALQINSGTFGQKWMQDYAWIRSLDKPISTLFLFSSLYSLCLSLVLHPYFHTCLQTNAHSSLHWIHDIRPFWGLFSPNVFLRLKKREMDRSTILKGLCTRQWISWAMVDVHIKTQF